MGTKKEPELFTISYQTEFDYIWDRYLKTSLNVPKIYQPELKIHWKTEPDTITKLDTDTNAVVLGLTNQNYMVYDDLEAFDTHINWNPEENFIHIYHQNIIRAITSTLGGMKYAPIQFVLAMIYHTFFHEITHYMRGYRAWSAIYDARNKKERKKACTKFVEYVTHTGTLEDELETETEALRRYRDFAIGDSPKYEELGFIGLVPKFYGGYHQWLIKHRNAKFAILAVEYFSRTVAPDPRMVSNLTGKDPVIAMIVEEYIKQGLKEPCKCRFVK